MMVMNNSDFCNGADLEQALDISHCKYQMGAVGVSLKDKELETKSFKIYSKLVNLGQY